MKRANPQRGLSLIELLVALAIGSVLIVGAVYVFSRGRTTYAVNESVARLQENGRYVLSVLEPDIELAGYYGFTNSPDTIRFVSGASPGTVYAVAAQMRQRPIPAAAPVAVALPAAAHECGTNFAVDVLTPVQGSNDSFAMGPGAGAACAPYGAGAVLTADTLTIRRVETVTAAPDGQRLQLYASRLRSRSAQQLFVDGNAPGPIDADNEIHNLVVRAYYISRDAVDRPGLPSLRVKELGDGPQFLDNTEVMPGIEDLQVQFGIDTGDYDNDGVIDPAADANGDGIPESDGRATRYVNPDFAGLDRAQVVAVRVWVRVRADRPEQGFEDNRRYEYADVDYTPAGDDRRFRRVLMSRTIFLKNARTL